MPKFRYIAKITCKRYGIKRTPAVFETLKKYIMVNSNNNNKIMMSNNAQFMDLKLKNI